MDSTQKSIGSRFKFRAWHKKEQRWLSKNNCMMDLNGLLQWQFGFDSPEIIPKEERENEIVLMQSTGLFDKNGVEIFESDILQWDSEISVVKWCYFSTHYDSTMGWLSEEKNGRTSGLYSGRSEEMVIIGNIYSNPSLLSPIENA